MKVNIAYLTLVAVALGILKLVLYYQYFHVPITNFLDITEIVLLFTNDLILLTIAIVIPILSMALYFDTFVRNRTQVADAQIQTGAAFGRINKLIFLIMALGLLVYILVVQELYATVVGSVMIAMLGWIVVVDKLNAKREFIERRYHFTYTTLPLVTIFCIMIIHSNSRREQRNVNQGKYIGTTIKTKDSTYTSDANSFYIGRTSNYLFIYNARDSTSTVIPSAEVERMVLKTK